MENPMFSVEEIKELMAKLQDTNLGAIKVRQGDFSITIEAKETQVIAAPAQQSMPVVISAIAETAITPASQATAPAIQEICGNVVKSPIVGTFYKSAAPDKPAFVSIGSMVKKGDVLFIIESMKLMNEIQSEFDGEVAEIKISDGQGVEYGQPIMIIK